MDTVAIKRMILNVPPVRAPTLLMFRLYQGLRHTVPPVMSVLPWLVRSRETTNYTYDISSTNVKYLCATISAATKRPFEELWRYAEELQHDEALRSHIARISATTDLRYRMDSTPRYGRRLGWYVFARALKPKVIVETGVEKGLGSCILSAALMRNSADGFPGRYYGTDIDPKAGVLYERPYNEFGTILFGDSIASLERLDASIDLFINDSDHSGAYEAAEYDVVRSKMSETGVILGDNCDVTEALYQFSMRTGRRFVFFAEKPVDHWFPGGGIGIAYRDS